MKELLLDLKSRGLEADPELAVGDGALGFWKAFPQVWPATRAQRCWCHKTANILNYLPKGEQPRAKDALHQIWMAATRSEAQRAFDLFIETYEAKYPKAVSCLVKDRDELLAFYDFPAEHWKHLRATNPIESTFATVRLRTKRTRGSGSRVACLAMVFKLPQAAERKWRKLNGHRLLGNVIRGVLIQGRHQGRRVIFRRSRPQLLRISRTSVKQVRNTAHDVVDVSRSQVSWSGSTVLLASRQSLSLEGWAAARFPTWGRCRASRCRLQLLGSSGAHFFVQRA